MIILTALGTLGVLATVSVRGGMQSAASDRFYTIARYAAESGGAMAMDYMRSNIGTDSVYASRANWHFSKFIDNTTTGAGRSLTELTANGALPSTTNNPFTASMNAWFTVDIYNNKTDSGYATRLDNDGRVVIRATGHGPDGATAIIEWDVLLVGVPNDTPCAVYAQKNQAENNSGNNACLGTVDTSQRRTLTTP